MSNYLTEAFKKMELLENETFNLSSADGAQKLNDFIEEDELAPEVEVVIDPEATTEEEVKDSYLGDAILCCTVCNSMLYKPLDQVTIDEDTALANIDEVCPYCFNIEGFKVIGKVAPMEEVVAETNVEDTSVEAVEVDGEEVEVVEAEEKDELEEAFTNDNGVEAWSKNAIKFLTDAAKKLGLDKFEVNAHGTAPKEDAIFTAEFNGKALEGTMALEDTHVNNEAEAEDLLKYVFPEIAVDNKLEESLEAQEIITLDPADLIVNDVDGGKITVDKDIFNDYEFDKVVRIQFVGGDEVFDYKMVGETDDSIDMVVVKLEEKLEEAVSLYDKIYGPDGALANFKEEPLKEAMEDIKITTEDEVITVTSEERVDTESIQPISEEEIEAAQEDVVVDEPIAEEPIEEETVEEVVAEVEPVEEVEDSIEGFDEASFDTLGESYLTKVYENVKSYKTTSVEELDDKHIKLEGIIEFESGKKGQTSFIFESKDITRSGKHRFVGMNENLTTSKKAFTICGTINDNKEFVTESFNYNYCVKLEDNSNKRLYGTIRK